MKPEDVNAFMTDAIPRLSDDDLRALVALGDDEGTSEDACIAFVLGALARPHADGASA